MAAFGRVIQLGAFGKIAFSLNILLEVIIQSARLMIFFYALGLANFKLGALRIKNLFTNKGNLKRHLSLVIQGLKKQWSSVLLNMFAFLIIAWIINFLIDQLAYQTCLYITLKKDGIIAESSSEWTILLFFKNISVIPLNLIFNAILLLWLTNKLRNPEVFKPKINP